MSQMGLVVELGVSTLLELELKITSLVGQVNSINLNHYMCWVQFGHIFVGLILKSNKCV